ncbi:MAG TPA: response regulator transcription factor, partial [Flavisolibacter sp.]|nr:response regulator transcription factor [Flavisolibacter sp.]
MNTMQTIIRVIIADDHELYRDGFRSMLKRIPELDLVGEAADGKELLQLTCELQPDVIVTDIKMPRMDGIEATQLIKKDFPGINIIALSMFDDESLIVDMLEAGAKGYLLKNAHKEEIVEAVKAVYKNEVYYCNQTTLKLAKMIAASNYNPL